MCDRKKVTVTMRPHLLITREKRQALRSVTDVRRAITQGHSKDLWDTLRRRSDACKGQAPLLPTDMFPGRDPLMAKHSNPDYVIVQAAADRVTDSALAALLTGDEGYRDTALTQMEALFDEALWPEWRDLAHQFVAADLRTGQLSQALGMAYDWLHPLLSDSQRQWIVEGIDRCGIRRYLKAYEDNASYFSRQSNWQTCVVGGLGIAGMALSGDHPDAQHLIDLAHGRMVAYRSVYGPDGEFNENPGYAAATRLPVIYFSVYRYHTFGDENVLAQWPFPETCLWYLYLTSPPGRIAEFGDNHRDAPPRTGHYAAVAAAAGNGLLQWYYRTIPHRDDGSLLPFELLWYDDTLVPTEPEGQLPKGRAFSAHHGCISSRTDWNPERTPTLVFAKAGHGSEIHGHHDAGQVCIDGHGERLIVDLCSPPMYPADFFDESRYRYYNAGVIGHNVLMFDRQETAVGTHRRALIKHARFDESKGGCWTIDLTGCYDGVTSVHRSVIHLIPDIIAVLDEVELPDERDISLRWHTAERATPDSDGSFVVTSMGVSLSARIVGLEDASLACSRSEHAYHEPFNKGRLGDVFKDRHESYVEAKLRSDQCRILTLFAVLPPGDSVPVWQEPDGAWRIETATMNAVVSVSGDTFKAWDEATEREWTIKV